MKKRILIVDDDSTQTKVFEKIASQVNVKSYLVSTGLEAIESLRNHNDIGLVLLDLALPDISGLQVLEELKKLNSKVPVAILSATEDSKIAVRAGQLGAIDFFVKGKKTDLMRLFEFISETISSNN
jgi:DNA-binding NtrC family response regulator